MGVCGSGKRETTAEEHSRSVARSDMQTLVV